MQKVAVEAGQPALFEPAQLQRYTMGEAELEREVLGLFRDSLDEIRVTMGHARCAKEWRMATHTLKGSARTVGAERLACAAEQVEKREDCLVGGPSHRIVLDQIDASIRDTLERIDAYLASLS